jgi:hypothetical protein
MHPRNARHLAHLLDHLDADALAFGPWIARALQSRDHFVGDVHACDICPHPASRPGGRERADADENETFLVEAKIARLRHERL